MKQEDKELLLKDLCARLPYGVKIQVKDWTTLEAELKVGHIQRLQNEGLELKPFLRPISSMTMEEDEQRIQLGIWKSNQYDGQIIGIFQDISYCSPQNFQNALIWLLQNHFDIFGLIPKGLAIEVTEENNPYNIKEE